MAKHSRSIIFSVTRYTCAALAIAGCIRIPDYALLRVFQACSAIETLDLSFCSSVTDNVLLYLGKNCRRLKQLKLRGCRQISDTGVVSLANSGGVNNLVLLDLARFDLQYKFNDISLLSVAENCLVLQTLILTGCDMITDVGMDWLASGCSALTHLDVSGCTKLTDLSLRAMSENMLQLRHLNIHHCSRVSDLGIRHLSLGCPELAFLDAGGLLLLSDSHSSDGGGGTSIEEAYRQGIAALTNRCPRIRHLDLSKCTTISDGTLHNVATACPELSTLLLAGCYRVTSAGVSEVLLKCSQLSSLNVTGCDKVTDRAFTNTTAPSRSKQHLHHQEESVTNSSLNPPATLNRIHSLRLRGCHQISDAVLTWLSKHSPLLRELDISDCAAVTDMGMLAIVGSPMAGSLRSLWLRGLVEITQTGLSWLAEKCTKLLLLDLTGCRQIHSFSLKSLAASWKFALYVNNEHFKGMAPRQRAEDWLFIEEYGDCWRSAVHIQCMYRARVARRLAQKRREERLVLWVAMRLQSVYRGRQARKIAIIRRFQFNKETDAAKKIQAAYRKHMVNAEAQRLRNLRYQEKILRATRTIQQAWRRKKLRERLLGRYLRRLAYEDKLRRAAIQIQRHWRGRQSRMQSRVLQAAKRARDREAYEAARKMQNLFRARAARREANHKREELRNEQLRRERAAGVVQAHIRRRRAQKELRAMREYVSKVNGAAGRIQQWWRARKKFLANQILLLARRKKREYDAAVKLQAMWKRRQGRLQAQMLRLAREMRYQQLVDAALMVQTNWRGRHGRLQAHAAKKVALEKIVQLVREQHHAVTLVQAHFRGRRGRERYREEKLQKKKRWKRVVRPENGEAFYYNIITGEVRFRHPQDVLDLLPKPVCENCATDSASLAHVECKDCGEMFCEPCWANVHAGGRRRCHEFRALYDFYGKRVDYGDGEFPSRWPSEIEQDEMEGWGLRTYPRREPDEVKGSWERYVDPDTSREWFYNKETNENTYVPPELFALERTSVATDESYDADTPEWTKYYDEIQAEHYYFNHKTQESTFTRPALYASPRISPAPEEMPLDTVQDGWEKYMDPQSGQPYYYNRWTTESVFARPIGFTTAREVGTEANQGWAKFFDSASGVYYYFNAHSNESHAQRPHAFSTPRVSANETTTVGMDGSTEFYDPATGKTYCFNPQTAEVRQVNASTEGPR